MARSIRVGDQLVPPGQMRVVPLPLPGRSDAGDAIPVCVVAGARPGPRITVLGAPRGFEVGAARVALGLRSMIDPLTLHGSIVVVPVLRPGGHFAARGNAVRDGAAWRFPGNPGGSRRAREAFGVFSELVVGSSLVLLLTAAEPGFGAALAVYGDLDDPRVRRLSLQARGTAAVHVKPAPGSLTAAATDIGAVVLELRGPTDSREGDESLCASVFALLAAAGSRALPVAGLRSPRRQPVVVTRTAVVRAPIGGFLEQVASPGDMVRRGNLLARVVPPFVGRVVDVAAPNEGVVLQATTRTGVRARAPLFVVGRLSRAAITRARDEGRYHTNGVPNVVPVAALRPSADVSPPLHVGWVERVSLPNLGVERLRAKIDTGARTSALHVTRMTVVGASDDSHRRPILELTLPAGSRRGAPPATVRVVVRDHVQVKDTSGRTERRPVIETTLRLGILERRIRVTLTNRGDMLFPLLIGRTALGAGVVVDPARRLLLTEDRAGSRPSARRPATTIGTKPTLES